MAPLTASAWVALVRETYREYVVVPQHTQREKGHRYGRENVKTVSNISFGRLTSSFSFWLMNNRNDFYDKGENSVKMIYVSRNLKII